MFTITTDSANVFGLGANSTSVLSARVNSTNIGSWLINFGNVARSVFHLAVDTTDANPLNRVRFYIDGKQQMPSISLPPAQNMAFTFVGTESICLGNRDTQGRSMDGVLYYAALYADALTDVDIAKNAEILKESDDR